MNTSLRHFTSFRRREILLFKKVILGVNAYLIVSAEIAALRSQ